VRGCGRRRGVLRGRGSSARAATSRSTPPTSWPASTSASRSTALQQCSRATTSARRGRPSSSAWRAGRWCDYRSWHRHRLRQGLRSSCHSHLHASENGSKYTGRRGEARCRGLHEICASAYGTVETLQYSPNAFLPSAGGDTASPETALW
jgi:hypothetical protein